VFYPPGFLSVHDADDEDSKCSRPPSASGSGPQAGDLPGEAPSPGSPQLLREEAPPDVRDTHSWVFVPKSGCHLLGINIWG